MSAATPTAGTRGNGVAVAGFVCGLIGAILSIIPFFWLVFPGILDVLGIVFGIRGRRNAAAGATQGGLATAGLVLGIVGLVFFVLWWVLVAVGVRDS